MSSLNTVLYDLDGTLIDHFSVLTRCYRFALEGVGLAPPTAETVRRSVGGSMEVTMRKFTDSEHHAKAVRLWREHFQRIFLEDVSILPGGLDLVRSLHARGMKQAVFTNKIGHASRALCDHLGLTPYLAGVFGALDTAFRKPMPEFSRHVLKELQAAPEQTCLIGDSPYDIEAARAGGFVCYVVTTGSHTAEELPGAAGVYPDLHALGQEVFAVTAHANRNHG